MKKILIALMLAVMTATSCGCAWADASEAFMSLPFGHMWGRTKLRMERGGAVVTAQKKGESLTMKGMFEGREAVFMFNFVSKKGLSSKVVNIGSLGNRDNDRALYDALHAAYTDSLGKSNESSSVSGGTSLAMRAQWAPDLTTRITLSYNPNAKRFARNLITDCPIRLSYVTTKWSK